MKKKKWYMFDEYKFVIGIENYPYKSEEDTVFKRVSALLGIV